MSSEWCQNKRCPEKKTQGQIRGKKGAKYYQSNKAIGYYDHWCSMGCREQWWIDHKDTCIQAVGFIDKQILPLDDAWYVEYNWGYNGEPEYKLRNKLKGVKQTITQQQAQSPEDIERGHTWCVKNDTQAKELAIELGLAS